MTTTTKTTETVALHGMACEVSGVMRETSMRCRARMSEGLGACHMPYQSPRRRPPRALVAPLRGPAGPCQRMHRVPLRARRQAQACGRRRRGGLTPAAAALGSPECASAAPCCEGCDEGSCDLKVEHPRSFGALPSHRSASRLVWDLGRVRWAAGEPRDRPGGAVRASATASNSVAQNCNRNCDSVIESVTYASLRVEATSPRLAA